MCWEINGIIKINQHIKTLWLTLAIIVRVQEEKESRAGAKNAYWVPNMCQEMYYVICIICYIKLWY